MKPTKKSATGKETKPSVPEEKKSKVRLYWEDQERRGVPPGIIHNMRAVLR